VEAVIGSTVGTYTIQRELGRGGMGAVYVGAHSLLGRQAAIKVLLPQLSRDQNIVQRFFNEARAATAIKHPGIVEIYDFGFAADGSAYIVMEMLRGESLADRLRRAGRLAPAVALQLCRQVATALGAAHRIGIVHRDLKPDNIFLVPDEEVAMGERVKLLDFGIAKLVDAGQLARTSVGAIMGTPYYMAPEQARGAIDLDHRADLYALGCVLYEMLCGRPPFVGDNPAVVMAEHLATAPPPLRAFAPDVPPPLEAIAMRLIAKSPAERHATTDELVADLGAAGQRLGMAGPSAQFPAVGPTGQYWAQGAPSTTLGGAAAQAAGTVPPPTSGTSRAVIIGSVVVTLGAIAAIVIILTGAGSKVIAKAPVVTPPPAVVVDAAVAEAAPPDAAAAVEPAADEPVEPTADVAKNDVAKDEPKAEPRPASKADKQRAKLQKMLTIKTGVAECDAFLRTWARYMLCKQVTDDIRAQLDVDGMVNGFKMMTGADPGTDLHKSAVDTCTQGRDSTAKAASMMGCNVN
jgi:eukaryotic-like serine/threonine-protein kinase